MNFSGLIPATVTPFDESGMINHDDLKRHVKKTSSVEGVFGVAVNGHAGEILSLNSDERALVVNLAKKSIAPGRKLIAGIDGRSIDDLVREGSNAKSNGADALLVLPPFDVRPYRRYSKDSKTVHKLFQVLSDEVDLPMVVFLYPDNTGCSYPDSVLEGLSDIPNVNAIKTAGGTVTRYSGAWERLKNHFSVLAANDSPELLGMLIRGAHGSLIGISVIGTEIWAKMVHSALGGRIDDANKIFNDFCIPLAKVIFENQAPVTNISATASTKEALFQMGEISSPHVRFPSIGPDALRKREISDVLRNIGLIQQSVEGV